jgi:hypothetical protein
VPQQLLVLLLALQGLCSQLTQSQQRCVCVWVLSWLLQVLPGPSSRYPSLLSLLQLVPPTCCRLAGLLLLPAATHPSTSHSRAWHHTVLWRSLPLLRQQQQQ